MALEYFFGSHEVDVNARYLTFRLQKRLAPHQSWLIHWQGNSSRVLTFSDFFIFVILISFNVPVIFTMTQRHLGWDNFWIILPGLTFSISVIFWTAGHSWFLIFTDFYLSNTDIVITFWSVLRVEIRWWDNTICGYSSTYTWTTGKMVFVSKVSMLLFLDF